MLLELLVALLLLLLLVKRGRSGGVAPGGRSLCSCVPCLSKQLCTLEFLKRGSCICFRGLAVYDVQVIHSCLKLGQLGLGSRVALAP